MISSACIPTLDQLTELKALRDELCSLPLNQYEEIMADLPPDVRDALTFTWRLWARPEQVAPEGDWDTWAAIAGRMWGKSRAGAEWVIEQAAGHAGCRIALIGRIPKDVRDVMIDGESGILACSPPWFTPEWNKSLGHLIWPNGSLGFAFSGEVPDDLRGPQFHFAWIDEWAKFRFPREVWDQLMFALRLGRHPRVMVTTTPRPLPALRELMSDPRTVLRTGTSYDNKANIAENVFNKLQRKYEGTALGAQELLAQMLDDVKGALWSRALLESTRVSKLPEMRKVVMGVDPSVTTTEHSAETGIVIVGEGVDGHAYVFDDLSADGGLDHHGLDIIQAWKAREVDTIVGEVNNGGDLIEHTLRMVRDPETDKPIGKFAPYKSVRATRGKRTRAEPVQMLYQQKRVHHVGLLADLEDQMCSWVPDSGQPSPDRMDALVWAMTELMVQAPAEITFRHL